MTTLALVSDHGFAARHTRVIPEAIKKIASKIKDFSELKDDWDGYGAVKPTQSASCGAMYWATLLFQDNTCPLPDVFPVPNGNIQFEWSCLDIELEIEVQSISTCYVYFEDFKTGVSWEKEFTSELFNLASAIAELSLRNTSDRLPKLSLV